MKKWPSRVSLLGGLLMLLYGSSRGWPLAHSLEKALLVWTALYGASLLTVGAFVRLLGEGSPKKQDGM